MPSMSNSKLYSTTFQASRSQPFLLLQPHLSPSSVIKMYVKGLTAKKWWGMESIRWQDLSSQPCFKCDKPHPSDSKNFNCVGTLKCPIWNSNLRMSLTNWQFLAGKNMLLMRPHLVSGYFSN